MACKVTIAFVESDSRKTWSYETQLPRVC